MNPAHNRSHALQLQRVIMGKFVAYSLAVVCDHEFDKKCPPTDRFTMGRGIKPAFVVQGSWLYPVFGWVAQLQSTSAVVITGIQLSFIW
jgi:hypothetical protein